MDKNEIDIKSLALKMKMRRFTMKSVAITGYYDASNASIAFIDPSEYVWHVSNRYGTILSIGVEENSKYYAWMKEVSKRKTTKDLHERYRAVLVEGIDYAMIFDWLACAAKNYGFLSLCKISNFTEDEKRIFTDFFLQSDSPETIIVQFELYANPNDKDVRV